MSYIFKQKFNINELAENKEVQKKILLLEPEYYLRSLFFENLQQEGFNVNCADTLEHCLYLLKVFQPDLAVISPHVGENYKFFLKKLGDIRNNYSAMPILTVGQYLPTEVLLKILDLGVTSHLERTLSRPKDLVLIIKTII